MTASTLLAHLHHLGVTARAQGDTLRLRPASVVPAELWGELRQHKPELMALLGANDGPTLPAADPEQAADEAADRDAVANEDAPQAAGQPYPRGPWAGLTPAEVAAGYLRAALIRPS